MQQLTVLGTGVLGSQIIFQSAYAGKDVVAYDINDEILQKLPERWEYLKAAYAGTSPMRRPRSSTPRSLASVQLLTSLTRCATQTSSSRPYPSASTSSSRPGRPSPRSPHRKDDLRNELVDAAAERHRAVHRSAGEVPRAALRERGLEVQRRRGHGPRGNRRWRIRAGRNLR